MEQITIHAKLVAEQIDGMGYTNYVFEDLNPKDEDFRYIMCVRFPNWEQKSIKIDEIGYLNIRYVEGGKDTCNAVGDDTAPQLLILRLSVKTACGRNRKVS